MTYILVLFLKKNSLPFKNALQISMLLYIYGMISVHCLLVATIASFILAMKKTGPGIKGDDSNQGLRGPSTHTHPLNGVKLQFSTGTRASRALYTVWLLSTKTHPREVKDIFMLAYHTPKL